MKIAKILFVVGLIMFPIIGLAQTSEAPVSPTQPTATIAPTPATINPDTTNFCGDGKCDTTMGETTANCEKDCSQPTTLRGTCGDKICQTTESKSSCSVDCGYPWVCGDEICGGTETSDNCPKDCLQSATTPAPTTFGGNTGGGIGTVSAAPAPTPATSETPTSKPTAETVLPYTKCGVSATKFCNECGAGVYKNVFVKCSDGSEVTLGVVSSCKPVDLWNQYAKEACTNHCSSGGWGGWSDLTPGPIACVEGGGGGGNISTSIPPTIKSPEIPKATPVCYISDNLMQQYSQLILELQKSESDKVRGEEITKQIIKLKQQIATQQNECVHNSPQPTPTVVSWPAPTPT